MKHVMKMIIAVTGASGSVYARLLIHKLCEYKGQIGEIALILSETGQQVWDYELGEGLPACDTLKRYYNANLFAPMASGSAGYHAMVVIPCSVGTMGRIASGVGNDLITRSADVMLKERKPLILVVREAPYGLIHIENMRRITLAGGTIYPASPSFYSKPKDIDELVDTVVDRILGTLGFDTNGYRWGSH